MRPNTLMHRILCCRHLSTLTAIALVVLHSSGFAQEQTNIFTKGPYLQAPGTNTMTIMWESLTNGTALVRYGVGTRLDQQAKFEPPPPLEANIASSNAPKQMMTFYIYEATLTNLAPGTQYSYVVEHDGVQSKPKHFKTFSVRPDKVTFIAYGDTRTKPDIHKALAANFKRYKPELILHTGDLVERGKQYNLWSKEFFNPLAEVIDEIPLFAAIGNHEEDGTNYLAQFRLPETERWYSFDHGPIHVLALDYHFARATNAQFQFAEKDLLQSKAPWKIVLLHYPVFNVAGHITGWGHDAYLPLLHKAKVDMVIAGHSHIYERFKPVAPGANAAKWPITHITSGGGGAPLYASFEHPALVMNARTNHFVYFEATADSLKGTAITTNGAVIDRFELKKSGGNVTTIPPAQIFPEELLRTVFDVGTNLAAKATTAPSTTNTVDFTMTFGKARSTSKPLELEITLSPPSAEVYELENGPIQVTTPVGHETNKVVVAKIRVKPGKKAETTGRSRDLTPELIFQTTIKSEFGQTIAYGEKSRISRSSGSRGSRNQTTPPTGTKPSDDSN
jgi:acid phosphatase type 7